MGMYDTIKYKGRDWQTKDLLNNLDVYVIDETGVSAFMKKADVWRSNETLPDEPAVLCEDELHGYVSACEGVGDPNKKGFYLEWVRFKFTDGKLTGFINLGKR